MAQALMSGTSSVSSKSIGGGIAVAAPTLYPLRFVPIFQYRLWGGRQLADMLTEPLPPGPIGEAWVLSDRKDHMSMVAEGALQGRTIAQLMERYPVQLLGKHAGHFQRFPLLLKFLDAQEMLSVQVHPTVVNADLLPAGESAKTEAWVVLEAEAKSHIYAGLKPGTTSVNLRQSLADGRVTERLACFSPKVGDAVFVQAGTVHSLGCGIVVFEVQQNSDVTFRLYDWGHLDAKTGTPRPLQVAAALDCIDLAQGVVSPSAPELESSLPVKRERLFDCEYFRLWRLRGESSFTVGAADVARVLVCITGGGDIEHGGARYPTRKGNVFLLPATLGACTFHPVGAVTLLEIALPE